MNPALWSVGVLVAGAVIVLLETGYIGSRSWRATASALPFAIGAAIVGLVQVSTPTSLAVVALCGVSSIALLLLPLLRTEVPTHVAESAALLLLGTAGAIALASATDLLWAVVGLETLALSAVTLVAVGAGEQSVEAAFKYFVLGALSLAATLYGLGLVYLGSGALLFPSASQIAANPLTLAGVVLVGLGFAFELALVPLHWGALDAYTGSAPALAGFVMSASKLAAAFALGHLVVAAGVELSQILIWIGSLTIAWGTFGALAQAGNLRRMLAYSAITHAGFIGLALGCAPNGPTVAVFYAALYGSMAMLVFAALAGQRAPDIRELGPVRAVAFAVGLFSLAGIPPTPGFWAKLAVLVVAWQSAGPVPTFIAVAGGVFSVLYYLRPVPDALAAIRGGDRSGRLTLGPGLIVALIAVVIVGLAPGLVWSLARAGSF